MKLYQCSWIYHSHLRFRLTLRDIHRWFAKLERAANQRQEFIHESTPAETQAVLIRNYTNLRKHRRNRREQKNFTPFLKWSFRGHQHHLTKTPFCHAFCELSPLVKGTVKCFFTIIWTTCFLLIMCFIHGAGAEYFIQISFVHENGTIIFMTKKCDWNNGLWNYGVHCYEYSILQKHFLTVDKKIRSCIMSYVFIWTSIFA